MLAIRGFNVLFTLQPFKIFDSRIKYCFRQADCIDDFLILLLDFVHKVVESRRKVRHDRVWTLVLKVQLLEGYPPPSSADSLQRIRHLTRVNDCP